MVNAFGSIISILNPKKKELETLLLPYYESLDEINSCDSNKDDKELMRMIIRMFYAEELKSMERIENYKRMAMRIRNKDGRMSIIPLLAVKQIPITDIFSFKKIKKTGRRTMVSCPLHVDLTPSLLINTNNTWKCFSCNKSGSVIDLMMELYGFDFITAVKKIQQLAIELEKAGKETL